MRISIEKLLQDLLLSPLGWSLWCLALGWFFLHKNKVRAAKRALAAGVILLLVFSSTFMADLLGIAVEREVPLRAAQDYPAAQAIVLLGGSVNGPVPPRLTAEEISGARVLGAVRLFKAGKAPLILVSGGELYTGTGGDARTQATDLRDLLVESGIPPQAILMETESRNTKQNAEFSAKILQGAGKKEILLVTSAYHLGRATKLYEKAGFLVTPVATSHEQTGGPRLAFAPKASNLEKSARFLKEYFGRAIGR